MKEQLSKAEIRKDALQDAVQAAAGTVGQIATIVTAAVKEVAGTVGGFASELFEIRDAARRAAEDHEVAEVGPAASGVKVDPESPSGGSEPAAGFVHPDPDAPTA
jgi:phytoene/squalene synthetase